MNNLVAFLIFIHNFKCSVTLEALFPSSEVNSWPSEVRKGSNQTNRRSKLNGWIQGRAQLWVEARRTHLGLAC